MKQAILVVLFLTTFLFLSPHFTLVHARVFSCVVTQVGDPKIVPTLPEGCSVRYASVEGLTFPALLDCDSAGYCKMPSSPEYEIYSCANRRTGAREMIGALYTVGLNFKANYPAGHFRIGDITAAGHKTHFWGIAADINGRNGQKWVANFANGNYDRDATIALGKMIVDTGQLETIWFNDTVANAAIFNYARSKFPQKFTTNVSGKPGLRPVEGHDDHFHFNIAHPKLVYRAPNC